MSPTLLSKVGKAVKGVGKVFRRPRDASVRTLEGPARPGSASSTSALIGSATQWQRASGAAAGSQSWSSTSSTGRSSDHVCTPKGPRPRSVGSINQLNVPASSPTQAGIVAARPSFASSAGGASTCRAARYGSNRGGDTDAPIFLMSEFGADAPPFDWGSRVVTDNIKLVFQSRKMDGVEDRNVYEHIFKQFSQSRFVDVYNEVVRHCKGLKTIHLDLTQLLGSLLPDGGKEPFGRRETALTHLGRNLGFFNLGFFMRGLQTPCTGSDLKVKQFVIQARHSHLSSNQENLTLLEEYCASAYGTARSKRERMPPLDLKWYVETRAQRSQLQQEDSKRG